MFKKFWHDPVWSKVIGGVILAAVVAAGSYVLSWWPTIGDGFRELLSFIVSTTPVWNWLLALLIVGALATVVRWAGLLRILKQPWRRYTEAAFNGYKWRWTYDKNGKPIDLRSYCAECDYEITDYSGAWSDGWSMDRDVCPGCNTMNPPLGSKSDVHDEMQRRIERKIRTGDWAKADDSDP